MKHRLRIAVSVFFALATVLLLAMWIASNRGEVSIRGRLPGRYDFGVVVLHGSTGLYIFEGNADWVIAIDRNQMAFDQSGKRLVRPSMFFYRRIGFSQAYNFPLWVPIVVSGATAILLGFPYTHRFSLRTMLVTMTLIAVMLGLVLAIARQ